MKHTKQFLLQHSLHGTFAVALLLWGTAVLGEKSMSLPPLPGLTAQSGLLAQLSTSEQSITYSPADLQEPVTIPADTDVYFRCSTDVENQEQKGMLNTSAPQESLSEIWLWGYEFSGAEVINDLAGEDHVWNGRYFISESYLQEDPSNSIYNDTRMLRMNRWHFVHSSQELTLDCNASAGLFQCRGACLRGSAPPPDDSDTDSNPDSIADAETDDESDTGNSNTTNPNSNNNFTYGEEEPRYIGFWSNYNHLENNFLEHERNYMRSCYDVRQEEFIECNETIHTIATGYACSIRTRPNEAGRRTTLEITREGKVIDIPLTEAEGGLPYMQAAIGVAGLDGIGLLDTSRRFEIGTSNDTECQTVAAVIAGNTTDTDRYFYLIDYELDWENERLISQNVVATALIHPIAGSTHWLNHYYFTVDPFKPSDMYFMAAPVHGEEVGMRVFNNNYSGILNIYRYSRDEGTTRVSDVRTRSTIHSIKRTPPLRIFSDPSLL